MNKSQKPAGFSLIVENIPVLCKIGVTRAERRRPRALKVCLNIRLEGSGVFLSDRVEDTVDYSEVVEELSQMSAANEWQTLEAYAYTIGKSIKAKHNMIRSVIVEACKKHPAGMAKGIAAKIILKC